MGKFNTLIDLMRRFAIFEEINGVFGEFVGLVGVLLESYSTEMTSKEGRCAQHVSLNFCEIRIWILGEILKILFLVKLIQAKF